LANWTIGEGPGARLELLNGLTAQLDAGYLVVTDDDVTFSRRGLLAAIKVAHHLGMDLAQPAHGPLSRSTYEFNRFKPGILARRTMFVEQGPVLILSPTAQRTVLPFPVVDQMGWGVEVHWYAAAAQGLVLGILDAIRMTHHGRVGASYNRATADRSLAKALSSRDITSVFQMQTVLSVYSAASCSLR
jgi:hypothetical protein